MCESKKSKFIEEEGARGLLTRLLIRVPLNKTPLVGPLF